MKIKSIKINLNKERLDTVMKAMRAIEQENKSEFYKACDQVASDTGTSREDVVFHILCSTYQNALSIIAKGWGIK